MISFYTQMGLLQTTARLPLNMTSHLKMFNHSVGYCLIFSLSSKACYHLGNVFGVVPFMARSPMGNSTSKSPSPLNHVSSFCFIFLHMIPIYKKNIACKILAKNVKRLIRYSKFNFDLVSQKDRVFITF